MKTIANVFLRRTRRARWVHAIVLSRVIVGALLLGGCVSAPAYEQANSATDVERERGRRAQVEMEQVKAELARLTAERDTLAAQLRQEEDAAARARLDVTTSQSERDQQVELVGQLQSELARVAEHLKTYSEQRDALSGEKDRLELELSAERAKTAEPSKASAEELAPSEGLAGEAPSDEPAPSESL